MKGYPSDQHTPICEPYLVSLGGDEAWIYCRL